jgi:hypothetical protein
MRKYLFILAVVYACKGYAQQASQPRELRFDLNAEGTHFFQATLMNQVWLRFNQSNPSTTVEDLPATETFDIGLRRTRMQLFGQLTDKVFLYFQFGMNNFNSTAQVAIGRMLPFFTMHFVNTR